MPASGRVHASVCLLVHMPAPGRVHASVCLLVHMPDPGRVHASACGAHVWQSQGVREQACVLWILVSVV